MKHKDKILYISTTSRLGGGEGILLNILERLDRTKFEPIVLLPEKGKLEDELKKKNIKFAIVSNKKKYSKKDIFSFLVLVARYVFWILKENITLVHVNGLGVYRPCAIAARLTQRKIVCHLHSPTIKDDLDYALIIPPDSLICCCADIAQCVKQYLKPVPRRTSLRVLINAIDGSLFHPISPEEKTQLRRKLNIRNDCFIVTTIGDLSLRKGQKEFLLMAKDILVENKEVKFQIIGTEKESNTGYTSILKELANSLNIAESVDFLGYCSNPHEYVSACDLFVLPSKEEGLPLVILEAMGCAKPVVASSVNGIPEAISHNKTGFLVQADDVLSLTKYVRELLTNSDKRELMGLEGRKYVEQFFHLDRYVRQLEEIYSNILENHFKATVRHRLRTQFMAYVIKLLLYPRQKISDRQQIKKILIVLLDYIGDGVLSSPIFSILKKKFPQATVDVMVGEWTKDLYKANPSIRKVIPYNCDWLNRSSTKWSISQKLSALKNVRKEEYDLIVDMRGSLGTLILPLLKSSRYWVDSRFFLHEDYMKRFFNKAFGKKLPLEDLRRPIQAKNILRYVGITNEDQPKINLFVSDEHRQTLKDILRKRGIDIGKNNIISFHPGVHSRFKRWDVVKWAQLADRLIEKEGAQVVICGGKADLNVASDICFLMKHKAVNLTGQLQLMQLAALIEISSLCVCLDSGPMHMAGALNVPVVGLFGANHPSTCSPWTDRKQTLYHQLPCSLICTESEEMGCAVECMQAISAEEAFDAAQYFLEKNNVKTKIS